MALLRFRKTTIKSEVKPNQNNAKQPLGCLQPTKFYPFSLEILTKITKNIIFFMEEGFDQN